MDRLVRSSCLTATPTLDVLRFRCRRVVEQIVRAYTAHRSRGDDSSPTKGQIDDLIDSDRKQAVAASQRVLVTTLTKKMAEDLTDYCSRWVAGPVSPFQRRHDPAHRDLEDATPG